MKIKHIAALTAQKFKGDCFAVVKDYEIRQHSRSKNMPIQNNNCVQAIRLLYDLTFNYSIGDLKISIKDLTRGLKIKNGEIMASLVKLEHIEVFYYCIVLLYY